MKYTNEIRLLKSRGFHGAAAVLAREQNPVQSPTNIAEPAPNKPRRKAPKQQSGTA